MRLSNFECGKTFPRDGEIYRRWSTLFRGELYREFSVSVWILAKFGPVLVHRRPSDWLSSWKFSLFICTSTFILYWKNPRTLETPSGIYIYPANLDFDEGPRQMRFRWENGEVLYVIFTILFE